jgi:hypothetical protein
MKSSKERDGHTRKPRASDPAIQKTGTQNCSAFINSVLGKKGKRILSITYAF